MEESVQTFKNVSGSWQLIHSTPIYNRKICLLDPPKHKKNYLMGKFEKSREVALQFSAPL